MPRRSTFPILFNDALQLNISKLKEWGYLKPDRVNNGTITWSRNGNKRGSISISVNTLSEQLFIELDYKYNNEPRKYKISIVSIPSNLGKGTVSYFECPVTKKRCRKLYSINGCFLHRAAHKGIMYESQIQSKSYRMIEKNYGAYFNQVKLYEQLYKKNFKKTYAGKPTKKYLKIMEQLKKAESIPYGEIERLFIK
jgi:hypothetical protein